MKFKKLILSSLILIGYLSANAYAIQDPSQVTLGTGESLADKLIENSNSPGVFKSTDTRFAATPGESKKLWANRTNILDKPMPKSLDATGSTPQATRANAELADSEAAQNNESTAANNVDSSASTPETSSSGMGNVSGSWAFTLDEGNNPKNLMLTLFQSGNDVYGTGSMRSGNSTLAVAASGSKDGEKMNLDVTTIGTISTYKMALNLDGDSASGDYSAFAANGDTWNGQVSGILSAAQ